MSTTPPAGWFPDPERPGTLRYWDGAQWTDARHEGHPAAATSSLFPAEPEQQRPAQPAADAGARIGGYFIDVFVYLAPALLAALLAYSVVGDKVAEDGTDDPLRYYEWWGIGTWLVTAPLYALIVSLKFRGQSVGKRVLKLRVVTNVNQEPLGRGRAFVRECLAKPIMAGPSLIGLVGGIMMVTNSDRRSLHDQVMGTRVVRADAEASPFSAEAYQPAAVTPTAVATGSASEAFGEGEGGRDAFGNPL